MSEPIRVTVEFGATGQIALRQGAAALGDISAKIQALSYQANSGGRVVQMMQADLSRFSSVLHSRLGPALNFANTAFERFYSLAGRVLRYGLYAAIAQFAILVGVIRSVAREFFEVNQRFGELEVTLKSVYGSVKIARAIRDEIAQITIRSPLQFRDIAETVRSFAAMPSLSSRIGQEAMAGTMSQQGSFLRQATDLVAQMVTFRPDKLAQDATFAIREAVTGELRSLIRRFEFPTSLLVSASGGKSLEELKRAPGAMFAAIKAAFDRIISPAAVREFARQPRALFGNLLEQLIQIPMLMIGKKGELKGTDFYNSVLKYFQNILESTGDYIKSARFGELAETIGKSLMSLFTEAVKQYGVISEQILKVFHLDQISIPGVSQIERIFIGISRLIKMVGDNFPIFIKAVNDFARIAIPAIKSVIEVLVRLTTWIARAFAKSPLLGLGAIASLQMLPTLLRGLSGFALDRGISAATMGRGTYLAASNVRYVDATGRARWSATGMMAPPMSTSVGAVLTPGARYAQISNTVARQLQQAGLSGTLGGAAGAYLASRAAGGAAVAGLGARGAGMVAGSVLGLTSIVTSVVGMLAVGGAIAGIYVLADKIFAYLKKKSAEKGEADYVATFGPITRTVFENRLAAAGNAVIQLEERALAAGRLTQSVSFNRIAGVLDLRPKKTATEQWSESYWGGIKGTKGWGIEEKIPSTAFKLSLEKVTEIPAKIVEEQTAVFEDWVNLAEKATRPGRMVEGAITLKSIPGYVVDTVEQAKRIRNLLADWLADSFIDLREEVMAVGVDFVKPMSPEDQQRFQNIGHAIENLSTTRGLAEQIPVLETYLSAFKNLEQSGLAALLDDASKAIRDAEQAVNPFSPLAKILGEETIRFNKLRDLYESFSDVSEEELVTRLQTITAGLRDSLVALQAMDQKDSRVVARIKELETLLSKIETGGVGAVKNLTAELLKGGTIKSLFENIPIAAAEMATVLAQFAEANTTMSESLIKQLESGLLVLASQSKKGDELSGVLDVIRSAIDTMARLPTVEGVDAFLAPRVAAERAAMGPSLFRRMADQLEKVSAGGAEQAIKALRILADNLEKGGIDIKNASLMFVERLTTGTQEFMALFQFSGASSRLRDKYFGTELSRLQAAGIPIPGRLTRELYRNPNESFTPTSDQLRMQTLLADEYERMSEKMTTLAEVYGVLGFSTMAEQAKKQAKAFAELALSADIAAKAIRGYGNAFGSLTRGFTAVFDAYKVKINDFTEQGAALASALTSGLEDALGAIINRTKKAGEAFEEFGRKLIQTAAKIMVNKMIESLLGSMFGWVGSGGVGRLFGGGSGATASSSQLDYLLGGEGKMLGEALPVKSLRSGVSTGPISISISINEATGTIKTQAELEERGSLIGKSIRMAIQDEIVKMHRQGGLFRQQSTARSSR